MATYKQAKAALDQHGEKLRRLPGVTGTGLGARRGEIGIVLYVTTEKKAANPKLPRQIDGVEVYVEVVGDITAR